MLDITYASSCIMKKLEKSMKVWGRPKQVRRCIKCSYAHLCFMLGLKYPALHCLHVQPCLLKKWDGTSWIRLLADTNFAVFCPMSEMSNSELKPTISAPKQLVTQSAMATTLAI